jgi:hypothetical protein
VICQANLFCLVAWAEWVVLNLWQLHSMALSFLGIDVDAERIDRRVRTAIAIALL